jgi:uncharacterized protein YeaO (DUF488 family)
MSRKPIVMTARVYEAPLPDGGVRVLVDRVWPRGVSKERANVGEWCKQAAPSTALREWYGHEPSRFAEFAQRYRAELTDAEHSSALEHLRELAEADHLTLVTATKTLELSQAAVLADVIREVSP